MSRGWIVALGLLAAAGGVASGQEVLLTYGVYYSGSWLTTDGALRYSGQTSPSFSLRLRGLLTPLGSLYADMAATGAGTSWDGASFAAQSYSLSVFATRPTSSFLFTGVRSQTASLSSSGDFVSTADALVLSLGLRPLRDVFVNLQYATVGLATEAATGSVSSYSSTTNLGAFAVLRPVTVTFTQAWTQGMQTGTGPPSVVTSATRNIGVLLDQALARGLGLQVSANAGESRITDAAGSQERSDTTATMRLVALPVRGLLVEGRLSYDPRLGPSPLVGVGVRAEPWRMVQLDASYDAGTSYRSWWATFRAFPSSKAMIWASASASERFADGGLARDRRSLVSGIFRLSQRADLTVDHFWSETTTDPARAFQEWSLAYVHRPTSVVTYRLAYRLSDEEQGGVPRLERTLGGDVSWLLSPRASLSLSTQVDLAGGAGLSFSSAWLRWAADARTDVFASYRHHREANGASTGWSVTLARRLASGASLQVMYDAQRNGTGDRRLVMVVFQNRLGAR